MDHIASPYGYFFLIGALVGVTPIYIYIIRGAKNICVGSYFLVPLRELFRVGSCKRC